MARPRKTPAASPPQVKEREVSALRKMVACPVCHRPGSIDGKVNHECCSLFSRVRMLQWHEDPVESTNIGLRTLRMYHEDMCSCGRPKSNCRARKVRRALAYAKKKYGLIGGYADEFVADYLRNHACE